MAKESGIEANQVPPIALARAKITGTDEASLEHSMVNKSNMMLVTQ